MTEARPDTPTILAQLKDFQRDTVDYVFRRLYLDSDCVRRFLIADEVGLGKTHVARGVIARAIDHLRDLDSQRRIDIVYVCSNADIARQNINRLNVTGQDGFSLASRITLLPLTVGALADSDRRLNFISFTPGTSFEIAASAGRSDERELLYWLLHEPWSLGFVKSTRVLHAYADIDGFRRRVERFPEGTINAAIRENFARKLASLPRLREEYDAVAERMPRVGAEVPASLNRERNALIGRLRQLLAQTCLHWLQPDLIILDEFQRFKHLLQGEGEAAELAHDLFNYEESQGDPTTAARVLLLSATPYKMFTQQQESEQEDHYADFRSTLDFLLPDPAARERIRGCVGRYRDELFRLADRGVDGLLGVRAELQGALRKVMVRTERLALKADRNGMLTEVASAGVNLSPRDVRHYLAIQRVARSLDHDDILEYWKSAPYLLNFMDNYDLKRRLHDQMVSVTVDAAVVRAIRQAQSALLSRDELLRYERVDPANARLRAVHHDTVERGAWRMLWIPPSLPYYAGAGPFAEAPLIRFTKRLVFSCWKVVPKAIAGLLSYDAERRMMQCFRKKARNTPEARRKRRALLRFAFSKGRPTGMSVLGMIYPCRTLAEMCDPLRDFKDSLSTGSAPPTLDEMLRRTEERVRELLGPRLNDAPREGAFDESWYWAAPLLLDLERDPDGVRRWFSQPDLSRTWGGEAGPHEHDAAQGWNRHVELARESIDGKLPLGRPPDDLVKLLALIAVAGPGVVAYRALSRIVDRMDDRNVFDLRRPAAPLAHAFLHLFNLPDVIAMLRDREKAVPYWQSVLRHCADGNLQSVMDEFAHILVESLGLVGRKPAEVAAAVSAQMQRCITLRTSTARADMITSTSRKVRFEEPVRLRTRFAMRFGDQEPDEDGRHTRVDQVRAAFNSPFWPFVLVTTSVGQEGLDFHPYCHAVVHWNLPSNPVDLEQREGRVHRYKGHALRRNIAEKHADAVQTAGSDPWEAMFAAARSRRNAGQNDLYPFWLAPDGQARIERHVPMLPLSRDALQHERLLRSLVIYRMVFGQNRQDDLVGYLSKLPNDAVRNVVDQCRVDLSPPVLTPTSDDTTKS